ncbi:aspartate dehydrogenase [Balneicella halophila]|uniref:Aspartate dehydrogenase n=1 Tax=Balneicella halophila TaxID=1537566 RepID=A0A7L4UPG1_BALHA|nr:aspartate dehydrogenase domain-containing protein [Balneicella halophila]PVX51060.1 aspartate dehydrogenase [Balneicella halophila]
MKTHTFAIIGCGKLANIVVDALIDNMLPEYELIGCYSRTFNSAEKLATRVNNNVENYACKPCKTIDELFQLKPKYIVETATPNSLKNWGINALKNGSSIITLSIGAFSDDTFKNEMKQTAEKYNTRIHIASGAIGGLDILRTASLFEDCEVSFTSIKGAHRLKKLDLYDKKLEKEKREVFRGNAKEAIELLPTGINVAVATALASVGTEKLDVSVHSVPDFKDDEHIIELSSDTIKAEIDIFSSTSKLAGWSIVSTMRNIQAPITF